MRYKPVLYSLATAGMVAAIVALAGNRGPHNHSIHGEVVEDKELYGDPIRGYATERPGFFGGVEKKVHDVLRPGAPRHLLRLQMTREEYDTKDWFETVHHSSSLSEDIFVVTDWDEADVGDTFSASREALSVKNLDKVLLARGVRYTRVDGTERTKQTTVKEVYKSERFLFQRR